MHDYEALTRRWFEEVWNKGRAEAIDEMFAPDGVAPGLGNDARDLIGPAEFKEFFTKFTAAFSDYDITVAETIRDGDRVAVRLSCAATHSGDQLGVPATGRRVRFTAMTFTRWRDGKIVEGWNNVDMMAILEQIGAIAATGAMA
jgi:steroid delta-isomerase-like uncharacterized protein